MITEVSGSAAWVVPIILVLMGIGMTIGNLAGGYLADLDLRRTLIGGLIALAIVLALLALTAQWIWAIGFFVFLVGLVSSVLSPSIQTRLMDVAGDNQSIAAALNHSALNMGNSLGAFLGGMVIAIGWGFVAPAWIGVALALLGLGIAVLSFSFDRRPALVLA
jgi:DHA1 family inner membrane transport protein